MAANTDKRVKPPVRILTYTQKTGILRKYAKLIAYLAGRYTPHFPSIETDDLIQEISLGFLRAAELYDARAGLNGKAVKFSAYASLWGRQYAGRHIIWHKKFGMGVGEREARNFNVLRMDSLEASSGGGHRELFSATIPARGQSPDQEEETVWEKAERVIRRTIGLRQGEVNKATGDRHVAVFMLKFRDGLVLREIVGRAGMPKSHQRVAQMIHRCLSHLRYSPEFLDLKPENWK